MLRTSGYLACNELRSWHSTQKTSKKLNKLKKSTILFRSIRKSEVTGQPTAFKTGRNRQVNRENHNFPEQNPTALREPMPWYRDLNVNYELLEALWKTQVKNSRGSIHRGILHFSEFYFKGFDLVLTVNIGGKSSCASGRKKKPFKNIPEHSALPNKVYPQVHTAGSTFEIN